MFINSKTNKIKKIKIKFIQLQIFQKQKIKNTKIQHIIYFKQKNDFARYNVSKQIR